MEVKNEVEKNWNYFAIKVTNFIKKKGKKYDKYKTLEIMSDEFCIDSIIKYAIEIKTTMELEENIEEGTLFSIAHYAEILHTRFINKDYKETKLSYFG